MDGNRRFARTQRIETVEGHNLGFEALARVRMQRGVLRPLESRDTDAGQILEVCYKSGVRVVTIYAFSIENFQRSRHEVEGLMALAKLKLTQLAQHGGLLARYGARIRILGQRELLRPDVLEVVHRVEALTQDNGTAVLNVCFSYTSRDEMTTAVRSTVAEWSQPLPGKARAFTQQHISHTLRARHLSAATAPAAASGGAASPAPASPLASDAEDLSSTSTLQGQAPAGAAPESPPRPTFPDPEHIDARVLDGHMHFAGMPPLDLLVRTSGVQRFSDFMLWQAHEDTEVVFTPFMWPEFDLWEFLPILVEWQWRQRHQLREHRRMGRGSVKVAS